MAAQSALQQLRELGAGNGLHFTNEWWLGNASGRSERNKGQRRRAV
jgi:hypothetical protein